jgi:hypothetical protein
MLQNVMLRGHRPDMLLLTGLILFSVLLYTTRANAQAHMPNAEAVAAELAKAESLDIS